MARSTNDFLGRLHIKKSHATFGRGHMISYDPMVKVIFEANRIGMEGHLITRVDSSQFMRPVESGFLEEGWSFVFYGQRAHSGAKRSLTNQGQSFQDRSGHKRRTK